MKKILLLLLIMSSSVFSQVITPANTQYLGTKVEKATVSSADWGSIPNSTYFFDISDKLVHYKDVNGNVISIFTPTDHPKGFFVDTTTQSVVSTSLSQTVTINTTILSDRISIVSGNKITVSDAGYYNCTVLFKSVLSNSPGNKVIRFWIRQNGVDVPISKQEISITSIDDQKTATVPFQLLAAANDYFQIMMSGTDTDLQVKYLPATASPTTPVAASVIVNIDKVSD